VDPARARKHLAVAAAFPMLLGAGPFDDSVGGP
jgi:hypothetical protein